MDEGIPQGEAKPAAVVSSAGSGEPQPIQPTGSHAAEWGLGALLSGIAISLAFPICLIVIGLLAAGYFAAGEGWTRSELQVATNITLLAEWVLIGLSALNLGTGLLGLAAACRRKQPVGMAVHGISACVPALFFSILLLVATQHVLNAMWKEQDRRDNLRERLNERLRPPGPVR
jgi:hypothetical protein